MSPAEYSEDNLVQRTTADYLRDALGWESIYAYNDETFGPEGTLGRKDDREVVLTRHLGEALVKLNPGLPAAAYQEAIRQVFEYSLSQSLVQTNQEKHELLRDGVQVQFRNDKGQQEKTRLRLFDFEQPEANHFLVVRELWVRGSLYRRRADIVGFVNGIPLLFMELKNIDKDLRRAFDGNLADYKDVIPHLFHHNAFIVLANGERAKLGSVTSRYEHFHEWKRLEEEEPGVVDMETLLKGVCRKESFLDLFENFIVFDDSGGKPVKIVARNHQFLGVNRAIRAVRERKARKGKLGVFWHTQGSGKSYSMVFFARKIRHKLGGNFTFLICTDREDLDNQIYSTFAGCGLVNNDKERCRAGTGDDILQLFGEHKAFVFTLVQKFNKEVDPADPYSPRDDIIVISDEAHRTQYGVLALNMRNALPNASYIGFTGTPLFSNDEITRHVFGDYVSTYDFQRAVQDGATLPLYYDARGEKLGLTTDEVNQRVAEKLEELEVENVDVAQRLERELKRDYHIITGKKRLEQIAEDFVRHYSTAWESGKAMLVCIDKVTCGRMHEFIAERWERRIRELEKALHQITDEQEEVYRRRQIQWMRETRMAVIVSEEQGEVEKFRKWKLDITPHRRLIKEGFETPDGKRVNVEDAFKDAEHPFRVAIVCAMWLTGFDVPSLGTLYLDKPLKAHTLMQAIARANRVHEGKNNGLIVDYCGILRNLRKALATFAGHGGSAPIDPQVPQPQVDPAKPEQELLGELEEALALTRGFLERQGATLDQVIEATGFGRNAAIKAVKDAINENDESRKRFEILAREVFKKFKACITLPDVNRHRASYDAINIVYRRLQEDRANADITDIIMELHEVVDKAVAPINRQAEKTSLYSPYDISRIDFDLLRREFERRHGGVHTAVQSIRQAVEDRLRQMLERNPLRTDFQAHYEEVVAAYNREKDRATIEQTFQELMRLVTALEEEENRAIREGLDEETLAIYDLLRKPDLDKKAIERIKKVACGLLETLKAERLRVEDWRRKQATRDAVRVAIHNFLYDERTGLPTETFTDEEVEAKTDMVYQHIFARYPHADSNIYRT